jgi:hypothetical protein
MIPSLIAPLAGSQDFDIWFFKKNYLNNKI